MRERVWQFYRNQQLFFFPQYYDVVCPSHLRGYIRCLSHPPEILTEVSADQHIMRHVASNAPLAGAGVVVIFSPLLSSHVSQSLELLLFILKINKLS